uniref:Flp pilus assembly complex ATPase component TadA n=1 Tax=Clostridium botulinum TaxID=1491 RepID=UPI00067AF8C2
MFSNKNKETTIDIEKFDLVNLKKFTEDAIDDLLKTGIDDKGLSIEEYEKRKNRKNKLKFAQKNCGVGDIGAKEFVKGYIEDLLTKFYGIDESNIDYVLNFKNLDKLNTEDKFHILLYHYKKQYKYDAFKKIIKKYELDELKIVNDERKYIITKEDIEKIIEKENINMSFEDKLEVITQKIYSSYKGLGVIDEIRDMNINGLSLGVNGLTEEFATNITHIKTIKEKVDKLYKSCDSIWLYFEGKEIHLEFLGFGSYKELERVCSNIYKFGNPGQLDQSKGFITNSMADNSRIVVLRPPFCESWVCFIRKFDVDGILEEIVEGKNSDKVIKLTDYIVKGRMTTAITGDQGAGKTTHLIGMIRKIYPTLTLRIWESFFETHLRNKLPDRNIVSIQETSSVTGEKGLDVLKKTNGAVTIIGEAAEDTEVAYIVKVAQVASLFTLFTHHAKTFTDLISALRNSLLNTGLFASEKLAEEQVIRVLDFNIHLRNEYGVRYIERITECVLIDDTDTYPTNFRNSNNIEDKISNFMETALVYFKKMTSNKNYKAVNIIEYDLDKREYIVKNTISENRIKIMASNMIE